LRLAPKLGINRKRERNRAYRQARTKEIQSGKESECEVKGNMGSSLFALFLALHFAVISSYLLPKTLNNSEGLNFDV
jgi:hypothetical protein